MMVTKEVVLGKVAAVGRKTYNASTQYHVLDIVAKDGQSYMALKDNVGIDPSTDSIEGTWMLLAKRGDSWYEMCVRTGRFEGTEEEFLTQKQQQFDELARATEAANNAAEAARANLEEVNKLYKEILQGETERTTAEQQRNEAEAARVQAEADRAAAEAARTETEKERVSSEVDRASNETLRAEAEQQRIAAEAERAKAEQERVEAEGKRQAQLDGATEKATQNAGDIERLIEAKDRAGRMEAISMDTQEWPTICGLPITVFAVDAPSVAPDFAGQTYMDLAKKKVYMAFGANSVSDWVVLN